MKNRIMIAYIMTPYS